MVHIKIKRKTLHVIEKAITIIAFSAFSLYVWIVFFTSI